MAYPPQPGPVTPAPSGEPILLAIGDIMLTENTVILPQGQYPLRGTVWTVQDSTVMTEGIPTVGIVLAIIFFWFCLLGLLFLLMKEKKYGGFVTITVTGPGVFHTQQFPAGPTTAAWAADVVGRARALAATAA
jgi:hypothetical protein